MSEILNLPNIFMLIKVDFAKKNLVVFYMFEGQDELRKNEFPQIMDRVWLSSAAFTPHAKSVVEAMNQIMDIFHNPTDSKEVMELFKNIKKWIRKENNF